MASEFRRILLPLEPEKNQSLLLRAATVFTSWFDAPLQIVSSRNDLANNQVLAASLGVPIEPVLSLEDPFGDGMVAHAHASAPALIVAEPDRTGLAIARSSSQPVFLAVEGTNRRMPVGPVVVEITGQDHDLDALATAAVIAPRVGEPIRLIIDAQDESARCQRRALADAAEARLTAMGCDVGSDSLLSPEIPPLVFAGRARDATAVIVPAGRLDEPELVQTAVAQGVNLIIAPTGRAGAGRPAISRLDLTTPLDAVPEGAKLEALDREECAQPNDTTRFVSNSTGTTNG